MIHDLRLALRGLVAQPGFSAVTIATLALGIGANTAIFTFVNAAWLRPLPVAEPGRLVVLEQAFSYPDLRDLAETNRSLSGLVAWGTVAVALDDGRRTERVSGAIVDADYFSVLGVAPALGRSFDARDDRAVVLSDALWRGRFGSEPTIAGSRVSINGEPFTVIGVAPPGFGGIELGSRLALWVPVAAHRAVTPGWEFVTERREVWMNAFGRLAPGVTRQQAQAELVTLLAAGTARHPDAHAGQAITVAPLAAAGSAVRSSLGPLVAVLMAVVGTVLLIACANLANLLLVRATARRREFAIRLALGAGRWPLIRQVLAECVVLAGAGGAAALLAAPWAVDAIARLVPATRHAALDLPIDARVLAFTALVCGLTTLAFGLAPALHATRQALLPALREGSAGAGATRGRLRGALVVAQVALALALLFGAGLFLRSLSNTAAIDPGFDPERLVLFQVDPGLGGYDETAARLYYRDLVERIAALPGVESVSTSFLVQLGFGNVMRPVERADGPAAASESSVAYNVVDPGYFATLGLPVVAGREFTDGDRADAPPVAIVNEALARELWPDTSPLGRRLRLPLGEPGPEYEVVGVARTSKVLALTEEPRPYLYLPLAQSFRARRAIHVRVSGAVAPVVDALRETVRQVDPDVPVYGVRTYREYLGDRLAQPVALATLVGTFAALALLLAVLGVYGTLAFLTRQRTREFGIRLALGARPAEILRLVVGQGLRLVAAGLALGLLLAVSLARLVAGLLFGVRALDPATLAGVTLAMVLVSLAAGLTPGLRATRIAPQAILRDE